MSAIVSAVEKFRKDFPGPLRVGVGIDGSELSEKAFDVACRILHNERGDRLYAIHVAAHRSRVPDPLHSAEHLQRSFERRAYHHRATMTFYAREKSGTDTTTGILSALAEELELDLLVVGAFGRKGEKVEVLGSVADGALRKSNCTVVVVRTTSYDLENSSAWTLAVDESKTSVHAFAAIVGRFAKKGDKITVMHASFNRDGGKVLAPFQHCLEHEFKGEYEADTEFCSMPYAGQNSVSAALMKFATDKQTDFLVMGISGWGKEKLGSVSEDVLMLSRVTAIAIKDPYEVRAKRAERQPELIKN
ncbi:unnamed protein product [Pedinophyceae sp. YPF-701]|nr:unnamed protein product [Pedinophyceae sp. YPF-701]